MHLASIDEGFFFLMFLFGFALSCLFRLGSSECNTEDAFTLAVYSETPPLLICMEDR